MQIDRRQIGWKFWRRWALASSLAWGSSTAAAVMVVGYRGMSDPRPVLNGALSFLWRARRGRKGAG